jgi:hypothetical protein
VVRDVIGENQKPGKEVAGQCGQKQIDDGAMGEPAATQVNNSPRKKLAARHNATIFIFGLG